MYPPAFQFVHGDHVCLFYQSEDSLTDILVHYIIEGLEKEEKCFFIQKPSVVDRIKHRLSSAQIDVEREIARGSLLFQTHEQIYFPDGKFEPEAIVDTVGENVEKTIQDGFSGLRTAGDLTWAIENPEYHKRVLEWELTVPKCYSGGPPLLGICQYPAKTTPAKLRTTLRDAHPMGIVDPDHASIYTWVQLIESPFIAEIITDRFVRGTSYSYIIRRDDSDQVLYRGDAPDFETAKLSARRALQAHL